MCEYCHGDIHMPRDDFYSCYSRVQSCADRILLAHDCSSSFAHALSISTFLSPCLCLSPKPLPRFTITFYYVCYMIIPFHCEWSSCYSSGSCVVMLCRSTTLRLQTSLQWSRVLLRYKCLRYRPIQGQMPIPNFISKVLQRVSLAGRRGGGGHPD